MFNDYNYNPDYFYSMNPMFYVPYRKPSLLQSMRYSMHQMNVSSTIKTAQKTLYTVNQIIPIINQLRPVIHNASTAFKVAKAVKSFNNDNLDQEIDNELNKKVFENMV